MIRFTATALLCLLGLTAPGCSLFHHGESQPQQFMNALNRGSSAQASQLWLNMSAQDRADLTHGIGYHKSVNQDEVARAMFKHHQEAEAKERADNPDDPANTAYNSDDDSTQVEVPGDPANAGLSNLPLFNATQSAAPITEVGPQ